MFLLKTLGILTKHCKKTLQESTLSKNKFPDRNTIRSSQKLGNKKKRLVVFNPLLVFYIYKLLYVYNLLPVDICPKTSLICALSTI